jgi:hypothetical protein
MCSFAYGALFVRLKERAKKGLWISEFSNIFWPTKLLFVKRVSDKEIGVVGPFFHVKIKTGSKKVGLLMCGAHVCVVLLYCCTVGLSRPVVYCRVLSCTVGYSVLCTVCTACTVCTLYCCLCCSLVIQECAAFYERLAQEVTKHIAKKDTNTRNGVYVWEDYKYDGEWNSKGLPHGKGAMLFDMACLYSGDWQDGKVSVWRCRCCFHPLIGFGAPQMTGTGKMRLASGDILSGAFDCGVLNGPQCVVDYANGDSFRGAFLRVRREGRGRGKGRGREDG